MATNRAMTRSHRPRLGCRLSLALALLLGAAVGAEAQDAPRKPREILTSAIDTYKRGDFEAASVLFVQAQQRMGDLSESERIDLGAFGSKNNGALKGRQEGALQVRQAEDALAQGRTADAARLIKTALPNPYLASTDRLAIANLNARLQSATPVGAKGDPKALLTAARSALKLGDFNAADALASEAEKAGATGSWLQPWADTPAKVRRDVQAARGKTIPPDVVKGPAAMPEKKEPGGLLAGMKNVFSMEMPPAANAEAPAIARPLTAGPSVPPLAKGPALPSSPNAPPPGLPPPDSKAQARHMLAEGYKALQIGDLETARQMADRARDLNVELERTELGPDQLLHEIQKKSVTMGKAPTDSRALVKEGRALLKKNHLDQAERLCSQAAAVPNASWLLFEDSPEGAQRHPEARAQHDRDESVKVLADARKLFALGQYDEAKKKAWDADKLHGPYGVLDFGDRPQRLLAEIARAEAGKGDSKQKPVTQVSDKTWPNGFDNSKADPLAAAHAAKQAAAVALIAEAREHERRLQLVEARQKAVEANKLGVVLLGEDSPAAVMQRLSGKCKGHIQQTLNQVTESVSNRPNDPARLQKAQVDLAGARQLALQFGLDTVALDQKSAWVHQAAITAGLVQPAVPQLVQTGHQSGSSPAGDPKRQAGLDKLEKARLELKHGNCNGARKLAEEAFDPVYGVKEVAEVVLRDIDAEEHNQRMLAAQRSFDAGVAAFLDAKYKLAGNIFANVDARLLPPQQQQRLRDIMSMREMDPQSIAQASEKVLLKPGSNNKPGTAVASDQGDEPLDQVRAMEKIQFEQMYQRNVQAQRSPMDLFKAGQKMKAVEVLTAQLAQIELARLPDDASRQLRTPLEKRIQEFRTFMAQEMLADARTGSSRPGVWNEAQNQEKIRSQQEQVSDMVKQCNALNKEGKYRDALALAHKAQQLDPDNQALTAIVFANNIHINRAKHESDKAHNEEAWLEGTRFDVGKMPTNQDPFQMDADALRRFHGRSPKGIDSIQQERKNPKEKAIEYRLDQPIHFGFLDTPLREVIDSISKLSGVPVYEDKLALDQENISLNHLLTMDSNGLAMKSALNILLGKMRLTYVIRNESLIITTVDKARDNFKRVVYPVADLIVPIDNHPISEVHDLTAVLQRHINGINPQNQGPSPTQTPYGLPPAPPVSQFSTGLAGAFGATSQSQAPGMPSPSPLPKRTPGQTMEDLLMDLIKGTIQPHTWKDMGGPGHVQYYPLGMALIVNQTQEVQGEVLDLLAALRRLQDMEIAIEMRLVSVSELFYERIGVDFSVNLKTPINPGAENQLVNSSFAPFGQVNRNLGVNGVVAGLTPAGTLTPDLNFPIRPSSFNFSVPPFGGYTAPGVDGGLSLGLAFLSDIQVFMILEAAQGDSRTNIMQAPKITVFNGQLATLSITTIQFVNLGIIPRQAGNGQVLFTPTNSPVPIGVTLAVNPVVSADRRFVRINLTPTLTNLVSNNIPLFPVQVQIPNLVDGPLGLQLQAGQPVTFTTFLQQPTFSLITMSTTVNVPDGGTVLLGGLKTMSEGRNEGGPPILSKIPYLNRLFRNVGWGREGQSLMILVTPRIIINEEEERVFMGIDPPIPRQ